MDSEQDGGQRRCTYCFQELNEMIDPRQLPCTHIVCLPCLNNDWKLDEPQCRACNKSFGEVDLLPKIRIQAQEPVTRESVGRSFQCDICTDVSTAVSFCIDCGNKICESHVESHNHYFHDKHKTVDISKYADRPDYYSHAYCEDHPNNTIENVCSKCYSIPCRYCTPGACQTGVSHHFQPLANIRPTIQAEFDNLMKKCSEKIAELCNLEKQTWRTVDDLNEKCEAMISQVEETTKQQVAEILKKSTFLKQEIIDYQQECLAKVNSYTTELIDNVSEIEDVQMSVAKFLSENHTAKIVKDRIENLEKLKVTSTFVLAPFELEKHNQQVLIATGIHRELEMKLVPLISMARSLTHMKDYDIGPGYKCRTLSLVEKDKLFFGCSDYLGVLDLTSEKVTNFSKSDYTVRSIDLLATQSQVFYLRNDGCVNGGNADFRNFTERFSGTKPGPCGRLSVSENYVAMCYSKGNQVLIYNSNTKEERRYSLTAHEGGQIRSICSAPDDSILTLDGMKGIVCCYKLHENTTPTLSWKCAGITGGYAICSDDQGSVYVRAEGKLYILFDGRLMNTVECPQLPTHGETFEYSDISVCGDCLVTTLHGSKTVRRFRLA